MDKAIELGLRALGYGISVLDAYLGREAMEAILDELREKYVAEQRPPTDEELLANVTIAEAINERIQNT